MIEQIHRYTESVRDGSFVCTLSSCPRCHESDSGFIRYDYRSRTFLVVLLNFVHRISSLLTRWQCLRCERTFTFYPEFAIRYKRYVRDTIQQMSEEYVNEEKTSYRQIVKEDGLFFGYHSPDEGIIDERSLAHSTVHRWLSSLGRLAVTLDKAMRLIKAKDPLSGIFRDIVPIAQHKYRSVMRKQLLQCCRRLLVADREFLVQFGRSVFPDFATACCWH